MKQINLSKSAQSVQDALSQKGLAFEVVELSSSTRTANDAAATIGCEVAQIVKSLLFRSANTNQPVLILASGINRVNEKTIEKLISEKIKNGHFSPAAIKKHSEKFGFEKFKKEVLNITENLVYG